MGKRSKRAERCERCRLHVAQCLCDLIEPIATATRLAVVMHHREAIKTTATAPLALACLADAELHLHGARDAPLDLRGLHATGRRVLVMFPSEDARPLDEVARDSDPRPVTLVVPDGTWRQASRAARRIPGLSEGERVTLPAGPPSAWGVRNEPRADGLSTFEAIARALGILESPDVQRRLEAVFTQHTAVTRAARGAPAGAASTALATTPDAEPPLPILHCDEHLVAIHKPPGLAAHRGWAVDARPALQRVRDQTGRRVFPVHRLDRATSGVMLFAFSAEVARDMQAALAGGAATKRYLALCRGHDASLTHVDHPLSVDGGGQARAARTDFALLGSFERYGLFEAFPHQGRTHQIRRHLKHASHPIVGDTRYGKGEHNRFFRTRFGFRRLALHCHRMTLPHPRGGETLQLVAPLRADDGDFGTLLSELGLLPAAASSRIAVRSAVYPGAVEGRPRMSDHQSWLEQVQEPIIDPDRPIIDPHHHLWREPDRGRPYLVEDLWRDTGSGHAITQTVFIECGADYLQDGPEHLRPVGETRFVAQQAAETHGSGRAEIAGIVAHADLRLGDRVEEVLDAHGAAAPELFRGIRHAGACAPAGEPLLIPGRAPEGLYADAAFRAGVRRLGQRGLTYDTWHYHFQNRDFAQLARAVPDTTMILDHFGTPLGVGRWAGEREAIFAQWKREVAEIATCDNVVAKLGGLAMPDNGFGWFGRGAPPTSDEFVAAQRPYYLHMLELFGPARCMFESNFPVDRLSLSYPVLWNGLKKIVADFSEDEKDALFRGTAARIYRLPPRAADAPA